MAAPRFINLVSGRLRQVVAILTSAGAGDGEKIVATSANGKLDDSLMGAATTGNSVVVKSKPDGTLDLSLMPSGIGPDTATIPASEALSAGNLVNVWNDAGTAKVRKADATAEGKETNGFVIAAVTSGADATVYFEGKITGLTGMTPGARQYLSAASPGARAEVPPAATGNVVQYIGTAYSATALTFEAEDGVTVA